MSFCNEQSRPCVDRHCCCDAQLGCLGHLTRLRSLTVAAEKDGSPALDLTGLPESLDELTVVTSRGVRLTGPPSGDLPVRFERN